MDQWFKLLTVRMLTPYISVSVLERGKGGACVFFDAMDQHVDH